MALSPAVTVPAAGSPDAEVRIQDLAEGLSLEQQFQLLTGADVGATRARSSIGVHVLFSPTALPVSAAKISTSGMTRSS